MEILSEVYFNEVLSGSVRTVAHKINASRTRSDSFWGVRLSDLTAVGGRRRSPGRRRGRRGFSVACLYFFLFVIINVL